MSTGGYNGWSNRETWLINVWFNPETVEDVEAARAVLEAAIVECPSFLQDFIIEDEVNWKELREACKG